MTDGVGSRRSRRQQLGRESSRVLVTRWGVASAAHEREKLERLCRTITRPAVSTERLSLTPQGHVRYRLKTPYREGTTDGVFEPLDNLAGSDFEQPQAGPQGEGQDARRIVSPVWPPGCRRHAST